MLGKCFSADLVVPVDIIEKTFISMCRVQIVALFWKSIKRKNKMCLWNTMPLGGNKVWKIYSDDSLIRTFVPSWYFPINEFSWLLNRPSVQKWKSVPALFVRISEISGLSEPGLTNHHCTCCVKFAIKVKRPSNLVPFKDIISGKCTSNMKSLSLALKV